MLVLLLSRLGRLGRLGLLAAGGSVAVCSVAGCTAASQNAQPPAARVSAGHSSTAASQHVLRPSRVNAGHSSTSSAQSRLSPDRSAPVSIVLPIGGDPARLAGQLTTAEALLGEAGATPQAMARQALIIQLACNPSWRYVDAVRRYARLLRADPNALPGYYYRQVIYRRASGWVLLPPGYGVNPAARAIPLRLRPVPRPGRQLRQASLQRHDP